MIEAYINGIQYEMLSDFSVTEQSGNKTSSDISVLVETQPLPCSGDIIELQENDATVFWGVCGIPKSPKYTTISQPRIYKLTCGNANALLANRICNVAFQNATVTQIVTALYNDYIADEGISLGTISEVPVTIKTYTAKDFCLQDAVSELADLAGAAWMIGTDHRFYFLAVEDFPRFPLAISPRSLLGAELQHTTKDYKTRTVQIISGSVDRTSTQIENYTFEAQQSSFVVGFPVASKPAIYVNNDIISSDLIGVKGVDDNNENIVFFFAYESDVVTYVTGSGFLVAGDIVRFEYTGLFPIRVSASNSSKIAEIAALTGTSGRREIVQIDKTITTQSDALQLAESLLSRFSEQTSELSFWLLSSELYSLGLTLDDTNVLTQITFDLPEIGISGNYVIVKRNLSVASSDPSEPIEQRLKITLTLQNRDYLRSYGETLSDLRRNVSQLAVREEDVVVLLNTFSEVVTMSEGILSGMALPHFSVSSDSTCIFTPLNLGVAVYPE